MELCPAVEEKLNQLNIAFQLVDHAPALTTEQADQFIEGIPGVRTKTMFLNNRKKTQFYLLIMDVSKRLDMAKFSQLVDTARVSLASAESLYDKMKLPPGVVSPFGLLNNPERDITVYIDRDIMAQERMSFHPNTNQKTIFLDTSDVLRFLDHLGYPARVIDL